MIKVREHGNQPLFKFAKAFVQVFFWSMLRWKVEGTENIPADGPVILSSNHIHFFDPPLVGASISRPTYFMAKEELFRIRFFGWLLDSLGAFPVKRGTGDKGAIKYALEVIKQGHSLTIFPEGHRSKDGKLGQGLTGVAFIARKAACPIVPVAVIGPYGFRKPVSVRFGPPIQISDSETNESLLKKIMEQIQILLDKGHVL